MKAEDMPRELTRYLGELEAGLLDAPRDARDEILDDVRAHVLDALDTGRPVAEVLAGLGSAEVAALQYRQALGLPRERPGDEGRALLILHAASVLVALLTACTVLFVLGFADRLGGLAWASALLPVVLAILPLLLPNGTRMPVVVANAVVVALLAVIGGFGFGAFYAPLALMMWAAVVVPWRIRHGLDLARSPLWRIFGGVLVAAPALLAASGQFTGTVQLGVPGAAAVVLALLLAVLFAVGWRGAYLLIAAFGLILLVLAMPDPGPLVLLVWWIGGAYLAIGLTAVATLRRRPSRGDGGAP